MPSFSTQIALPAKISRVVIQKAKPQDAAFRENYQKGWDAGYQAGMWQAELEKKQQLEQQEAQASEWMKKIQVIHEELLKMVISHMPQLVLSALSRVMQHHKYTDDEIFKEIQGLVQELSLAKSISIECSQNDMEFLQKRLSAEGELQTQGQIQWNVNPTFQSGEYVIQSDLGMLDGRRSTRIAHVHAALKNLL